MARYVNVGAENNRPSNDCNLNSHQLHVRSILMPRVGYQERLPMDKSIRWQAISSKITGALTSKD